MLGDKSRDTENISKWADKKVCERNQAGRQKTECKRQMGRRKEKEMKEMGRQKAMNRE